MTRRDKTTPPVADPKRGRNPGYAEDRPRDREDARQPVIPPQPNPDEAGLGHDPDAQPDPAKGKR